MATSLFISFLVAWLAVPLLADHFLTEKDAHARRRRPSPSECVEIYEATMQRVLMRPWLVTVFCRFLARGELGEL